MWYEHELDAEDGFLTPETREQGETALDILGGLVLFVALVFIWKCTH